MPYSFEEAINTTHIRQSFANKVTQKCAMEINKAIAGGFVYRTLERMRKMIKDATDKPYELMGYHNRFGNLSASIGGCLYEDGKTYQFGTRYYGYGTWKGGHTLTNPIYSDYPVSERWHKNKENLNGHDVVKHYLESYTYSGKGFRVVLAVAMPYASFFQVTNLFNKFNAVNPGVMLNYIPIRGLSGSTK